MSSGMTAVELQAAMEAVGAEEAWSEGIKHAFAEAIERQRLRRVLEEQRRALSDLREENQENQAYCRSKDSDTHGWYIAHSEALPPSKRSSAALQANCAQETSMNFGPLATGEFACKLQKFSWLPLAVKRSWPMGLVSTEYTMGGCIFRFVYS